MKIATTARVYVSNYDRLKHMVLLAHGHSSLLITMRMGKLVFINADTPVKVEDRRGLRPRPAKKAADSAFKLRRKLRSTGPRKRANPAAGIGYHKWDQREIGAGGT